MTSWIDSAHERDLLSVAQSLGMEVREPRGANGGAFGPCPACNAKRRHPTSKDRRLACGVRQDEKGWRCFQCDASGDHVDLVAWAKEGRRFSDLSDAAKARVREWFGVDRASVEPQRAPERRVQPEGKPAAQYPDHDELAKLWTSVCVGVDEADDDVASFLKSRNLNVAEIADRDLARVVPKGAPLPEWARFQGRDWTETGHRLVFPLYDAGGQMRSVLARRIAESDTPKSIAPAGCTRQGLVLADGLGRSVLATGSRPTWFADGRARLEVWIAEGEIDYLTAATSWREEQAPGCLGIFSGSWSKSVASRVPDGARITIATDNDEAGEKYSQQIIETFAERQKVALTRWKPTGDVSDLSDAGGPGGGVQRAVARATRPRGVTVANMRELNAMQLPKREAVGNVGPIAFRKDETVMLYGPPSVSKTLFALRCAIDVVMKGGTVLIVEGEGGLDSFRDRLNRIARGLREKPLTDVELERVNFVHGAFALEEDLALWIEQLEAVRPTVVVVDPMVSYFRGDENSSEDMSRFLRHVTLARDVGASVIVLHHSGKGDDEGRFKERGSSALRAWADHVMKLSPGEAQGQVTILHEKNREGARHPPAQMRWVFEESTSWIKLVDEASAPSSKSLASMKLVGRILAELEGVDEMRQKELAAALGVSGQVLGESLKVVLADGRVIRSERLVTNTRGAQVKGVFYRLTSAVHASPETGSSVHATTPASTREETDDLDF